MKERLLKIKQTKTYLVSDDDVKWLIKKVERYEKALEEILDITKDTIELEVYTTIVEEALKDS